MRVIGDLTRLNAKRRPEKNALVMADEWITYGQLNRRVNRLSHALLSLGVRPGDRVAILAMNCLECVIVNFAVAKCGGVVVPANFRYKKNELVYLVNNSTPKVLFYGPEFTEMLVGAREELHTPTQLVAIEGDPIDQGRTLKDIINGQPVKEPDVEVDPGSAFTITYTSGTTGAPKGVLASHSAFLNIYQGMALEGDVGCDEITMVALPLYHTAGMHALVCPTLLRGGTSLIMSGSFEPDKILSAVARYGVTMTMWVPTQLAMLVNYPRAGEYDLSCLKKIWYGSSPISPTVFEVARSLFSADFYQWYGQTETGMVSVLRPGDHLEYGQCTGREIYNSDLRIVDENGRDVGPGEIGEIISAQKPLGMISYHNMSEATGETIHNGYIHTGDLARNEGNGYFTIVDRIKDMIISGAENIYPKEVEDVIITHPDVLETAVIGIPDDVYGESVCAVVVVRKGHTLSEQELIDYCARRLSGYKKPKKVVFRAELPKNPSGKVTKNVLREFFWAHRERRI